MESAGSAAAGHDLFNALNISYENAYAENPLKISAVSQAITFLTSSPSSTSLSGGDKTPPSVLDIGCGTGVPVSALLSEAGLTVTGFDIAPEMVKLAQSRVKGRFFVSDMLNYDPDQEEEFAGVFLIFAHLQLQYSEFHALCFKFARALRPGGFFVVGQMPADTYVGSRDEFDETGSWVQDYDAPFMGDMLPTFMMTAEGQREFLRSMGLEIVWEMMDVFRPKDRRCLPEHQQYIIARRADAEPLREPLPLPKGRV